MILITEIKLLHGFAQNNYIVKMFPKKFWSYSPFTDKQIYGRVTKCDRATDKVLIKKPTTCEKRAFDYLNVNNYRFFRFMHISQEGI